MSFHPNEVQRRGRLSSLLVTGIMAVLATAFFRTQVLDFQQYALRSEENRLREVPLPAPRGQILDRHGEVIADNIPGYTVSLVSPGPDSLAAVLTRLSSIVPLSSDRIAAAVARLKRDRARPVVLFSDASFDEVSVLEEHRIDFPSLIIQAAPKRYYPDGAAVAGLVGYTGEISDAELNLPAYSDYEAGQQVGKGGLEREYEAQLRGREGSRFVEFDARGRVVRETGARPDLPPESGPPLQTNIDLDLQRFAANYFGDSIEGGVVVMEPKTGAVLALVSAPSFDPNRFIGGIPSDYWKQLQEDPRHPLYNKAIQGTYPPGSTFKLATAVLALEQGLVTMDSRMPAPCTGGYLFGSRYFRCWDHAGHGSLTLAEAIAKSCDVYFYQLGLKLTIANFLAGGVGLHFDDRSGIDLPNESRPAWPVNTAYLDRKYGPTGWTNATTLNLAIGQGENSQTVVNMARFYTALATDGYAATPSIAKREVHREKIIDLPPEQMAQLRDALASVVSSRGTAASAQLKGIPIAGKTGSAQNGAHTDAWFVGFAPEDNPQIVVSVLLVAGEHGSLAARVASKIFEHYLKRPVIELTRTEGG